MVGDDSRARGYADVPLLRLFPAGRAALVGEGEPQGSPDRAFLRAGVANGDVEPYEFTDIDRTVAAGLALKGTQWGHLRICRRHQRDFG